MSRTAIVVCNVNTEFTAGMNRRHCPPIPIEPTSIVSWAAKPRAVATSECRGRRALALF